MAQRSKKAHIVETALPLFLENGFKGTSIDLVVKSSGVSKPTVYNHFPDKAALMLEVVSSWVDDHKPLISAQRDSAGLEACIRDQWLTEETVRLYAIVIGEGFRFPEAKQLFWERFDRRWRRALAYVADNATEFDTTARPGQGDIDAYLDHRLIERLRTR